MFKSFRRTLGRWLPASRDSRILDIACGEGGLLQFLRSQGYKELSGFDLSPESVLLCKQAGLEFVERRDALDEDAFSPGVQYDVIFAMDIIEHIPKEVAAAFVEGLHRRLAPKGGQLILQTPNMGSLFASYHLNYDLTHEFGLTEKTALDLLGLAGFRPEQIDLRPAWSAVTLPGRLREIYLAALHRLFALSEGNVRPRIPTRNLLIRALRS